MTTPSFSKEDFEDVYATARMAHLGQKRRTGEDYFSHPSAVRNLTRQYYPNDKSAQLVALLHDTLEDAPNAGTVKSKDEMRSWILSSVADQTLARQILGAVEALTHEKNVRYDIYVSSLLNNELALRVKLVDMVHNLSDAPSLRQAKKYKDAIETLDSVAGGQPAGISRKHWDDLHKIATLTTENSNQTRIRLLVRELLFE